VARALRHSDTATGLSYLNARYYNGTQGQFISQDPVFLASPPQQNLQDPQSLNAYSYSQDNPITQEDPLGKLAVGFGFGSEGNVPGLFGGASALWVLTVGTDPFEVEVGSITSGEGGATTGVLGASGSLQFMTSLNAQNMQDLEGPEAVVGGSVKAGGDLGFDSGLARFLPNSTEVVVILLPRIASI
jgi:RHS repeat-associated protein